MFDKKLYYIFFLPLFIACGYQVEKGECVGAIVDPDTGEMTFNVYLAAKTLLKCRKACRVYFRLVMFRLAI